jgi:uncharacterized membrane protein YdbT with pleckstrin-like domain
MASGGIFQHVWVRAMSFTKNQLLPGENLVILARQHPFVLLKPVLLNVIVLTILAIVAIKQDDGLYLLIGLATLAYLFWKYLDWKKREYVLTDRRIVKQEGLLSVSSFDAPLDKINNVFHQQSLMGRIFRYGEVGLETASEQGTTIFSFLSNPVAFKNNLVRQRELYLSGINPHGNSNAEIPRMIEELAALRDRSIITDSEFEEKKRALLQKL